MVCTDRADCQTVTPHTRDKMRKFSRFLNEMQFTDCQWTDNHYYSLSDHADHTIDLTDCINASILDNPQIGSGFGKLGDTPLPQIPMITPSPPLNA